MINRILDIAKAYENNIQLFYNLGPSPFSRLGSQSFIPSPWIPVSPSRDIWYVFSTDKCLRNTSRRCRLVHFVLSVCIIICVVPCMWAYKVPKHFLTNNIAHSYDYSSCFVIWHILASYTLEWKIDHPLIPLTPASHAVLNNQAWLRLKCMYLFYSYTQKRQKVVVRFFNLNASWACELRCLWDRRSLTSTGKIGPGIVCSRTHLPGRTSGGSGREHPSPLACFVCRRTTCGGSSRLPTFGSTGWTRALIPGARRPRRGRAWTAERGPGPLVGLELDLCRSLRFSQSGKKGPRRFAGRELRGSWWTGRSRLSLWVLNHSGAPSREILDNSLNPRTKLASQEFAQWPSSHRRSWCTLRRCSRRSRRRPSDYSGVPLKWSPADGTIAMPRVVLAILWPSRDQVVSSLIAQPSLCVGTYLTAENLASLSCLARHPSSHRRPQSRSASSGQDQSRRSWLRNCPWAWYCSAWCHDALCLQFKGNVAHIIGYILWSWRDPCRTPEAWAPWKPLSNPYRTTSLLWRSLAECQCFRLHRGWWHPRASRWRYCFPFL